MVNNLYLIIPAILIAMIVMLLSARAIGDFMHSNPSIKVLGLGFVLLIGLSLFFSGIGIHISKGYLYFALFFSLFVEVVNIKLRKDKRHLHGH
jgi:predicted tellurium resistance membrane protein TerC